MQIVFATAKILIRKQFTTIPCDITYIDYCFCHCKDTNSKAIHNTLAKRLIAVPLFLPLQRY